MSHISINKVRIKNVNKAILKLALELMAKNKKISIISEEQLNDYRLTRHDCDFYIRYLEREDYNEFGIKISNENLEIVGDFWKIPKEKVEQDIMQYYKAAAVVAVMRNRYKCKNIQVVEVK